MFSELYPVNNEIRESRLLDGLWRFRFDPEGRGLSDNWVETGRVLPPGGRRRGD